MRAGRLTTSPEVNAPAAAAPVRTAPPWTRQRTVLLALVVAWAVALVAGWREIGMGVLPLFTGLGHIFSFLAQTVPPDFSGFAHVLNLALITVCMAVVGTALAAILAIPVGFMAARNTTVHPAARWVARGIIVLCRSVPDLVFAIVFVESIGIGVLPGVLALGFHSVGMVGKLYAETIEQVPEQPREAVAATGASRLQGLVTSVVPQVLPAFSSVTLYRLDINLRSSVVLGYVGAGGIGYLLNQDMGTLHFQRALAIVIVIFVLIIAMEVVSALIRRSLIGTDAPVTGARQRTAQRPGRGDRIVARIATAMPRQRQQAPPQPARAHAFDRQRVRPPRTAESVRRDSFLGGAIVIIVLSLWATKINPIHAVTSARQVWDTVTLYFPPDFTTARSGLVSGTLQSVSVALVATTVGLLFALPFGLLASRNVASPWAYRITRVFLVVLRAVPELILAIVFVVAVGLGLVAGTLALIVGTVAFLSKLVADGIEEVSPMPREAVLSAGAGKMQETTTSVLLPAAPALTANAMYMLDINFRSSAVLGIVGGGGIGFLLSQSMQVLDNRLTGAIIIITFAVVLVIEVITNWLRKQLI